MNLISYFILIFVCLSPSILNADFYIHDLENHSLQARAVLFQSNQEQIPFLIQLTPTYYQTNANYSGDGKLFLLEDNSRYQRMGLDVTVKGRLASHFTFFGRMSFAHLEQLVPLQSALTSNQLTDQTLGLNLDLYSQEYFSLQLQTQIDFPLYHPSQQNLAIGDGSIDFTPSLFLTFPIFLTENYIFSSTLGGGYTYRTQNYSQAIPSSVSFFLVPKKSGLYATLKSSGLFSLHTDSFTSAQSTLSEKSLMSGAINPSLLSLSGQLGYQWSPHQQISAGIAQSVWGENAPRGTNVLLQLQFSLGEPEKSFSRQNQSHPYLEEGGILVASVLKIVDRLNLVQINAGQNEGIKTGDHFDFYKPSESNTDPIAEGEVISVREIDSALKITEFFKDISIEKGFPAKLKKSQK